jgi:D-arabinose 1-dehydrogenase-like Zn-dependent alcohol dehydrogenase
MPTVYPVVLDHEIVGRVTKDDSAVTKYQAAYERLFRFDVKYRFSIDMAYIKDQ